MITLTALEPEDLDLLYTIENDTEMWSVGDTNVPYSRYSLRDYIANQQNDIYADKQLRLVIRVKEETDLLRQGEVTALPHPVGLIDLFNFSPEHSRAELGLAILQSEQGKGYATEALRQIIRYAHDTLHLHQIYCIVPIDNEPSLAMLRAVGFANEQHIKDWIHTPQGWKDAIFLQCLLS